MTRATRPGRLFGCLPQPSQVRRHLEARDTGARGPVAHRGARSRLRALPRGAPALPLMRAKVCRKRSQHLVDRRWSFNYVRVTNVAHSHASLTHQTSSNNTDELKLDACRKLIRQSSTRDGRTRPCRCTRRLQSAPGHRGQRSRKAIKQKSFHHAREKLHLRG